MPILITMRVIKTDKTGNRKMTRINISELQEVLSPEDLINMEMKLNSDGNPRFHIEMHKG